QPDAKPIPLKKATLDDSRLGLLWDSKQMKRPGVAQLSAVLVRDELQGTGVWPSGTKFAWTGKRENESPDKKPEKSADPKQEEEAAAKPVVVNVNYPLGAFGTRFPPERPPVVLFRGATVWTSGPQGMLKPGSVLVKNGRIAAVGKEIKAPRGAVVVELDGKHVTPGVIDCHSHIATDGGVNESTQTITAEVRIGDFIDCNDVNIYRQLASGVTSSNILHGSANTIGGQNQVIKMRWGSTPEEMKFKNAPPGIKFALGENVKQSNWGNEYTTRYPQTRMGVEQLVRDAFQAAMDYQLKRREWEARGRRGAPLRRDLELEAISEILAGRRWIHCHSYRQDEILALMRTCEKFNVTIGSFQHILEGYKVAEAMAKHGATGSAFSDWWAYKFEVYDAIPYNGAIMHRAGVVVSFNSDSAELARRLNVEAAKAVKYGGIPEPEALKFVTLNPAKQLRIDRWVGSLEIGKDADIAVWSGSPLSSLSLCEQTWIEGRRYFDRQDDQRRREKARTLKLRLVQLALASGEKPATAEEEAQRSNLWPREDIFCGHGDHAHGHGGHGHRH
ncbi:MAG: amidohydrolase, partial [Planctomycetales bacterium]